MSSRVFEGGVYVSKFLILVLLLILSYINCYTNFISNNPRYFLNECIVMGLSVAIAFVFVAFMRYQSFSTMMNTLFIVFLLFFIFNVLMEFSGMNNASTNGINQEVDLLFQNKVKYLLIPLGLIFIILLILALQVRDNNFNGRWSNLSQLILEACVVGIGTVIPTIMISLDRGENNITTLSLIVIETFVLFASIHFILQEGGFYSHVFVKQ